MFALPGGPHSQFPAGWNTTTAGLVKLGFAVLMGETTLFFSQIYTNATKSNTENKAAYCVLNVYLARAVRLVAIF